jgi:hypothetical protein
MYTGDQALSMGTGNYADKVVLWLRAQQNMCLPPPHLRIETEPVSETLCSLEYRMMDKVQKSSNPQFNVRITYNNQTVYLMQLFTVNWG